MEFIFDQNRSDAGIISNSPAIDDFKTNSPIRRPATRKAVQSVEDIEISDNRPKRRRKTTSSKPPVKYSTRSKKSKTRSQGFEMSWTKFGWMVCACLVLRLVFMDSGVIDYYSMESSIAKNEQNLVLMKKENQDLNTEIRKIKTSPKYQRKLAREHLGVISSNEYLVIFGKDS